MLKTIYAKHGRLLSFSCGILIGLVLYYVLSNFLSADLSSETGIAPELAVDTFTPPSSSHSAISSKISSKSSSVLSGPNQPSQFGSALSAAVFTPTEANYMNTMRSCYGSFCFDAPVKKTEQSQVTRVGILMPEFLKNNVAKVLSEMFTLAGWKDSAKVEIIFGTHVPPYGYGKNHGWSRIVRLVSRIAPSACTLLSDKFSDDTQEIVGLFEPQVKQLMRWHCRLSHVAAHTSMMTVFVDDLLKRPMIELDNMLSFAGHKSSRQELLSAVRSALPDLTMALTPFSSFAPKVASCETFMKDDTAYLMQEMADSIIQQEMSATKDLTQWPCNSFRDFAYANLVIPKLPLSVEALAANCSDELVTCSVRYDINQHSRSVPLHKRKGEK